jgi:hypothetical protein
MLSQQKDNPEYVKHIKDIWNTFVNVRELIGYDWMISKKTSIYIL